jgi:hypothetical protein
VYAPLRPFVTTLADRVWFEGNTLVATSGARSVRITLRAREPDALDRAYVPLAAVARALGAGVNYGGGVLAITLPRAVPLATPSPYDPNGPMSPVRSVFTPMPVPTSRPVWTGPALPRRTPLPAPPPR